MVIGGSFYATMIAVFAFAILLFKSQAEISFEGSAEAGDRDPSDAHSLRDAGAAGFGHLRCLIDVMLSRSLRRFLRHDVRLLGP